MTAAALSAALVLAIAAACQPRPTARIPGTNTDRPAPTAPRPQPPRWHRHRPRRPARPDAAAVARWCDELARAIRGGAALSAALRTTAAPPSVRGKVDEIVHALDRGSGLGAALAVGAGGDPHLELALVVLRACAASGGPPAEAIDRAAAALRGRAADLAERRSQSAQARASAIVMTLLPGATLLLLAATSATVRAALASPAGVTVVLAGAVLDLAGWRWMRRLIAGAPARHGRSPLPGRRVALARRRAAEALPDAIELVIVGIRAGAAPAAAVSAIARDGPPDVAPAFVDVEHRLRRGERLADALGALPERLGPDAAPFSDALATADRYGLPIEPVLDRLAADVRSDRRRHAERAARTLPVRLAFPLVTCILPAFVLLALAPGVLGALSTLRGT